MSALKRFTPQPEPTSAGALQAPACQCERALDRGGVCDYCGREVRAPGVLNRELRLTLYVRELTWAAGEGLDRATDFRGLSAELGPNPPVEDLHEALVKRVAAVLTRAGAASVARPSWAQVLSNLRDSPEETAQAA